MSRDIPDGFVAHHCPDCGSVFHMPPGEPFRCPRCADSWVTKRESDFMERHPWIATLLFLPAVAVGLGVVIWEWRLILSGSRFCWTWFLIHLFRG